MKAQITLVGIVSVFAFLIIMMAFVPILLQINTTTWGAWTQTTWSLLLPLLFVAAIICLIWYATPTRRVERE